MAEAVNTSHLRLATQRVPAPEDSEPPDLRSDGRGAEAPEAAAEENAGPN